MVKNSELSTNEAWGLLIKKYDLVNAIQRLGSYQLFASQIKEFKEPRLMAKWDSTESLPEILRKNRINILPNSRSSYVLGDFILYEPIPELKEEVTQMDYAELPELESVDINNITSEANAINVLQLTGILDDFLGVDKNLTTFNGRMGTGLFDFLVDSYSHGKQKITVTNAQCEIDGGFENESSIVILEAKNVVHNDFHVRQLYYPYRLWSAKVNKPIRLVFSIYSNMIFRLFEYRFRMINDYSSIELVKSKNYSLQDTSISLEDLLIVRHDIGITIDDTMEENTDQAPFIQANSVNRVISLIENMYEKPMTELQIAELMDFELRQANYYYNAGKYLGLFTKKVEEGQKLVFLTELGDSLFKLDYKNRQLKLVSLMLRHRIFAESFDYVIENGQIPPIEYVQNKMRKFNVCNEGQVVRRASSVLSWVDWIFNLTKL